jgi:hypothetical protein
MFKQWNDEMKRVFGTLDITEDDMLTYGLGFPTFSQIEH